MPTHTVVGYIRGKNDMSMNEDSIVEYYKKNGYTITSEYLRKLNIEGKISLMERSKFLEIITELEMKPKRNRKII